MSHPLKSRKSDAISPLRRQAVRALRALDFHEAPGKGFAMSRQPLMNSPFLLGFDEIEKALERVTRTASDGYPPYNIERLAGEADLPERLRITLAVAGFSRESIVHHAGRGAIGHSRSSARRQGAPISASRHRRATVPAQLSARRGHAGSRRRSVRRIVVGGSRPPRTGADRQDDRNCNAKLKEQFACLARLLESAERKTP